jgi:protein-tyrosine phosphatase
VISNILFVCIGNICRSPMAEGLFKQALPQKAVCSAGIDALVGCAADRCAVQLMTEQGIDISEHRAQNLATWMVNEADLIVTMDRDQKSFIEQNYVRARGKVIRLGEHRKYDIPDPYQSGLVAFRHSFNLIAQGIDQLVKRIAHQVPDGTHYSAAQMQESSLVLLPCFENVAHRF